MNEQRIEPQTQMPKHINNQAPLQSNQTSNIKSTTPFTERTEIEASLGPEEASQKSVQD